MTFGALVFSCHTIDHRTLCAIRAKNFALMGGGSFSRRFSQPQAPHTRGIAKEISRSRDPRGTVSALGGAWNSQIESTMIEPIRTLHQPSTSKRDPSSSPFLPFQHENKLFCYLFVWVTHPDWKSTSAFVGCASFDRIIQQSWKRPLHVT